MSQAGYGPGWWTPTGACAAPLFLIAYMNWIESYCRVDEGVTVEGCKINCLLSADDLVLFASSHCGFQHTFDGFSTAWPQTIMKISTNRQKRRPVFDNVCQNQIKTYESLFLSLGDHTKKYLHDLCERKFVGRSPTKTFRVSLWKFGQKSFAHAKMRLLLHLWLQVWSNILQQVETFKSFDFVFTGDGTSDLLHKLVHQTQLCESFITLWC